MFRDARETVGEENTVCLGIDDFYHDSSGGRAVAFPKFGAMGSISGDEEKCAVNVYEFRWVVAVDTTISARINIFEQRCAAAVPSVFQSSLPRIPSSAAK